MNAKHDSLLLFISSYFALATFLLDYQGPVSSTYSHPMTSPSQGAYNKIGLSKNTKSFVLSVVGKMQSIPVITCHRSVVSSSQQIQLRFLDGQNRGDASRYSFSRWGQARSNYGSVGSRG